MRRFQEWQENQTYFQHLSNLSKIMKRKPQSQKQPRSVRKEKDLLQEEQIELENSRLIKCLQNPGRSPLRQLALKHTQHVKKQNHEQVAALAYENFLFGKRILETEPVISKCKMDRDYELHLRTLKAMTQKKCDSSIRIRRLQQFRMDCDQTLPEQGQGKNCLSILINKFEMYRQKLAESAQISLQCQFSTKKVRSTILPLNNFQGSNFRFRFKKKWLKQGTQINIFVRYHKGNSDNQLGYFTIDPTDYLSSQNLQSQQQQTKPIIKRIGTVAGALAIDLKFYRIF